MEIDQEFISRVAAVHLVTDQTLCKHDPMEHVSADFLDIDHQQKGLVNGNKPYIMTKLLSGSPALLGTEHPPLTGLLVFQRYS
jgi:hypothetical protein